MVRLFHWQYRLCIWWRGAASRKLAANVRRGAADADLLCDLQREFGLSCLFVAHDYTSRRIAVVYLGKIVELPPPPTSSAAGSIPIPGALLSAVPPAAKEPARLA